MMAAREAARQAVGRVLVRQRESQRSRTWLTLTNGQDSSSANSSGSSGSDGSRKTIHVKRERQLDPDDDDYSLFTQTGVADENTQQHGRKFVPASTKRLSPEMLRSLATHMFLPKHYPESVTPNFLSYCQVSERIKRKRLERKLPSFSMQRFPTAIAVTGGAATALLYFEVVRINLHFCLFNHPPPKMYKTPLLIFLLIVHVCSGSLCTWRPALPAACSPCRRCSTPSAWAPARCPSLQPSTGCSRTDWGRLANSIFFCRRDFERVCVSVSVRC
jgi:hypothetical protein